MPVENLRTVWLIFGWMLVGAVIFISLMPEPPDMGVQGGDKAGHFLAYGLLMLWFVQVYPMKRWWRLAVGFVALGVLLEVLQGLSGQRSFEYADMLANSVGVVLGWLLGNTYFGSFFTTLERWVGR